MPVVDVKVCPKCGTHYDPKAVFCQKDGGALHFVDEPPDPYIGTVLLEQFRIEERVGVGGMGSVYRARQTTIGRDVAIKILHPELAKNPDAVRRFQREARVTSTLDHPNVVRVLLFGQLPDQSLYLVMQYLEGRPLSRLIEAEGALPPARALHIAAQVCDGVGEAHGHGVIHRDVKPENVILVERGRDPDFVKVLDFGIARFVGTDQSIATQTGLIFGTARYISPEGAAGERTDARSDVYSIGVLTYQLLCGETPFDSSSPVGLLMKHIHDAAPDIASHPGGASIPPHVARVVMGALAKNPEGRPDDAHALGAVLREAAVLDGLSLGAHSSSRLPDPVRGSRMPPTLTGSVLPMDAPVPGVAGRPSGTGRTTAPTGPMSPTLEGAPNPFGEATGAVPGLPRRRTGLGAFQTVLLAFVLGAVAVAGGAWLVRSVTHEDARVARIEELESRAQAAFARGDIDEPAGESVADLTRRLLEQVPDHEGALDLRRRAARTLRDQALAARDQGRYEVAREAFRSALALDADDAVSRRGLEGIQTLARRPEDPAPEPSDLRVTPASAPAGEEVSFVAVLSRGLPARARPLFSIQRSGRTLRRIVARGDAQGRTWTAQYVFRQASSYEVRFESGSVEEPLELTAEVEITRQRNARRSQRRQAPVTTQQPSGPGQPRVAPVLETDDGIDWRVPGIAPRPEPQGDPTPPVRVPWPAPAPPVERAPAPPAPWTSESL